MCWKTDRPEKTGKYIIIVPAIVHIIGFQDMEQLPQQVDGSVQEAWFNGKNFEFTNCGSPNFLEIGQCAWIPKPLLLCEEGGLTVFESNRETKKC